VTKIDSPDELQKLISTLETEGFYGDLHLTFRHRALTRIVTEESQVFKSTTTGRTQNEQYKRN
jgi:hypothetical protein